MRVKIGWMTQAILFQFGVRLSTWLALGLFVALGLRDRRAWWAAAAWLGGFEAAYQTSTLLTGHSLPGWKWGPPFLIALGVMMVLLASRRGVSPSRSVIAATVLVWIAWLAIGFPSNAANAAHLNVPAEVLNESAKTLWALALLVPIWSRRASPETSARPTAPAGLTAPQPPPG